MLRNTRCFHCGSGKATLFIHTNGFHTNIISLQLIQNRSCPCVGGNVSQWSENPRSSIVQLVTHCKIALRRQERCPSNRCSACAFIISSRDCGWSTTSNLDVLIRLFRPLARNGVTHRLYFEGKHMVFQHVGHSKGGFCGGELFGCTSGMVNHLNVVACCSSPATRFPSENVCFFVQHRCTWSRTCRKFFAINSQINCRIAIGTLLQIEGHIAFAVGFNGKIALATGDFGKQFGSIHSVTIIHKECVAAKIHTTVQHNPAACGAGIECHDVGASGVFLVNHSTVAGGHRSIIGNVEFQQQLFSVRANPFALFGSTTVVTDIEGVPCAVGQVVDDTRT